METSKSVEVSPSPPISNIYPESSFFTECRASSLPSPAEVRALNQLSGNYRATFFNRPSPVIVPSLGLFVKYGADVTAAEAETQRHIREWLQGQVPIPEVFGWTEDGGQVFIYMQLVQGETLQARFKGLDEGERQAICAELGSMVNAWRSLKQEEPNSYIGTLGQQPLNDIFIAGHPELARPFVNPGAVGRFQSACGIEIDNQVPITFTHNDLCPPNILLSPGPSPKVISILDWGQSGWYPEYWEYCKARRVGVVDEDFDAALQEEWHTKYLPVVIDPVDDEMYYHPWLYFMLSHI